MAKAGRSQGLITLEDVVAELLGGVSDEFKGAPARAILLADGSVRLPGAMRVDQAAQVLGATGSSPGETVGTFVTRALGGVPAPGEQVTVEASNWSIEAVEDDVGLVGGRPAAGGEGRPAMTPSSSSPASSS